MDCVVVYLGGTRGEGLKPGILPVGTFVNVKGVDVRGEITDGGM